MSRFSNPGVLRNGKLMSTDKDDFGHDIYSKFLLDFIERDHRDPVFVYYPMSLTHNPFVPMPITKGIEDLSLKQRLSSDSKNFPDMVRYSAMIMERFLKQLE